MGSRHGTKIETLLLRKPKIYKNMKKFNGKPPNLNAPEIFLGTKPNKSTTHHNGFSDVKIAMSLTLLNSRM